MSEKIPFLVVGDSPGLGTGLGRIARELTERLHAHEDLLGIRVAQLGMYHDVDTTWPWPVWRVHDEEEYGAQDLARVWWRFAGERPGVVLTIWDPARALGVMQASQKLPVRLWGYFPIDGVDTKGGFGGPAATTVKGYDRVLGYGRWGAEVLQKVVGGTVSYLPHGLDTRVWEPKTRRVIWINDVKSRLTSDDTFDVNSEDTVELPVPKEFVGCVMTNQPRKDHGTLFQAWGMMKAQRPELKFWLHTDEEVKYWSVPQLAEDFGLNDKSLTVTTNLNDVQLAEWYSACLVTMLPSLGEGFGYPLVESLACGTPSIGFDGAGGRELVPLPEWRVPATGWRLESCYNIRRPVFAPQLWAQAALTAIDRLAPETSAYCRGAVAHLAWTALFPRWASWVRSGVKEIRG